MQKRKWILFLLILSVMVTVRGVTVYATSAQQQKEEAEENLNDVNSQIEDLKNQQEENQETLSKVKAQLEKLLIEQSNLQQKIKENEQKMAKTAVELEDAKIKAKEQYEAMMIRIQYMYENSTSDSLLTAILESDGLIDMLNRMEYVIAVHTSDRKLTREYQKTVAEVERKKEELQLAQDELLMQQEAYLGRQSEIEGMIASLTEEQSLFESQIASAKKQAKAYEETIKKQDEIIRKQLEEERLKEEQLKAEQEAANNAGTGTGNTGNENAGNTGNTGNSGSVSTGSGGGNTGSGNSQVTGMDIVNFARRFVGNPYVWGGNSLTEGCDCSGFIHLVYKNFGYTVPRYSMSFLNVGTPVEYEDMQPGDIVIYERSKEGIGHVAIYMGNGKIVEAQSSLAGITDTRSVDCRGILGIRRIIN